MTSYQSTDNVHRGEFQDKFDPGDPEICPSLASMAIAMTEIAGISYRHTATGGPGQGVVQSVSLQERMVAFAYIAVG